MNLTLTFSSPVIMKQGLAYFFLVEPLDNPNVLSQRPSAYVSRCPYDNATEVVCEGLRSTYRYPIIRVSSEECSVSNARVTIPLPQLESHVHYGVRMSRTDMIVDAIAETDVDANTLERGRYLYSFVSVMAPQRVFASLTMPREHWNVPLNAFFEVRVSSRDLLAGNGTVLLRPAFGGALQELSLNASTVVLRHEDNATVVTIRPTTLLAGTTYELVLPATLWKHGLREAPGSERFFFRTTEGSGRRVL